MKEIISEINRNRELMGLALITEGVPPFDIIEVLMKWMGRDSDEIITNILKKTDLVSTEEKKIKDVFVELSNEFGMSTDDLVKKIQSGQISDNRLDTVISKLMLIDEELYEKLFNLYVLKTPIVKQIDNSIKTIKSLIASGQKKVNKYDLYILRRDLEDILRDSLDAPDGGISPKIYKVIKQRIDKEFNSLISELPEFNSPRQEAISAIKTIEKYTNEDLKDLTWGEFTTLLYHTMVKTELEGDLYYFRNDLKRLYKEFFDEYKDVKPDSKMFNSTQQNTPTVKTDVTLKSTENPIKPVSKVTSNTPPVTSKGWSKNVETESVGGFKINATLYGLEKIDSSDVKLGDAADPRNYESGSVNEFMNNGKKVFIYASNDSIRDIAGRSGGFTVALEFPTNTSVTSKDVKPALEKKAEEVKNFLRGEINNRPTGSQYPPTNLIRDKIESKKFDNTIGGNPWK